MGLVKVFVLETEKTFDLSNRESHGETVRVGRSGPICLIRNQHVTFWKTQVTHSSGESFVQQDLILRDRSSRA